MLNSSNKPSFKFRISSLIQYNCTKDAVILGLVSLILTFLLVSELSFWPVFRISLVPGTDMSAYILQANGILNSEWPDATPFFRAPLYSYCLALMGFIGKSLIGVTLLQAILFSVTVVLVMKTASMAFGITCQFHFVYIMGL